jgi:hypothetical protein
MLPLESERYENFKIYTMNAWKTDRLIPERKRAGPLKAHDDLKSDLTAYLNKVLDRPFECRCSSRDLFTEELRGRQWQCAKLCSSPSRPSNL